MFDAQARKLIDPPLNAIGKQLANLGIRANWVTVIGLGFGLCAAVCIGYGAFVAALGFVALNRLCDGLDGAVARATSASDLGGFLDIIFDFVFYGSIPLAFAIYAPQENALPAALLLFSFYLTGASFLAFAILAQKLNLTTEKQGKKSFFYLRGLAEGGETIAVFVLFCLFPQWFAVIAISFAALCLVSAAVRVVDVYSILSEIRK
ncbi:CDP-alcohol phosphatidyltransferase family protein [Rhodobacteraceae bacterium RKSG542]|uniref:CDP-alcohol phosphatidyltransferase family protein n=1 Tax=Pseudovibrio flavus TaxID=2529854 RepID=UPI0012BCD7A7|nr:CDP-alcohol phosphatidyltransferase family protein [Pseudovibrio flavus]MTI18782.1 CDP-alcohol phosphatidyltransferase family protein [Pseudovibrio flavus]